MCVCVLLWKTYRIVRIISVLILIDILLMQEVSVTRFIHSFIKHLMSISCVPGTVLDSGESKMHQTQSLPLGTHTA